MRPEKKDQKNDSRSLVLLLILVLGAGVFYFLGSSSQQKKMNHKSTISAYSPEAEALVNKHLLMTSKSLELQERKRKIENHFSAPQLGESIVGDYKKEKKDYGVDHSADTNESTAFDDLNRYPKDIRSTDPDTIITNQLHDEDMGQAYEEAYRQEYARQFIENARRNGYEVKLNDDFVVTSVKKIRTPSNLFLGPQAQ